MRGLLGARITSLCHPLGRHLFPETTATAFQLFFKKHASPRFLPDMDDSDAPVFIGTRFPCSQTDSLPVLG